MGSLQHAGTAAGMSSVVLPVVRRTAERHRGTSQAGARMPGSIGGGLAWGPLFAGRYGGRAMRVFYVSMVH